MNAEIVNSVLADATTTMRETTPRSVQFCWPDGFGVTSRIDEYCSIEKAKRDAAWFRREYLARQKRNG